MSTKNLNIKFMHRFELVTKWKYLACSSAHRDFRHAGVEVIRKPFIRSLVSNNSP
jgi:hypothetical protein